MAILESILAIVSTGAGGGVVGAITGLFTKRMDHKREIELANIELKSAVLESKDAQAERDFQINITTKRGEIELKKTNAETAAAIDIAHSAALGEAQSVFKNLKTSEKMNNFRMSVRPFLAYAFTFVYFVMLVWAFDKYAQLISATEGHGILIMLIQTLNFTVSSLISFYFVARRNQSAR